MKKLSAKKTAALVIGAAMCAAGLAAWIYQLVQGMQVTNLRNSFTWGLYMGSFEFFIAMATGGILAFSIAYLWNIETREWWHSALIPVNACAEATAVGLSFTILLCVLMVRHEIFVENSDGIRLLSRIAAASIAAYIVMSFIEIVPLAWSGTQESRHLLHLIFHTYGLLFWLQIILPLLAMILFLVGGGLGKELVSAAGILVIAGIFIQRMMLLLPAFNSIPLTLPVAGKLWTFPIAVGTFTEGEDVFVRFWNYVPTAVEWIVGILPVGLIVFVMAVAAILFRLNPGEE